MSPASAIGDYVTEDRISKIEDVLRDDESVKFLARCGGTAKETYMGETEKYQATKGYIRLAATNKRVIAKIPQVLNSETIELQYQRLTGVTAESHTVSNTIKLQSADDSVYKFRVDEPGSTEVKKMVQYIQKGISKLGGQSQTRSPSPDPVEKAPQGSSAEAEASSPDGQTANPGQVQPAQNVSQTRNQVEGTCVQCGNAAGDVNKCPSCGYDPSSHKTWFWMHVVISGIVGATIIGLLIVPAFWWKAWGHRKQYRRGVTG